MENSNRKPLDMNTVGFINVITPRTDKNGKPYVTGALAVTKDAPMQNFAAFGKVGETMLAAGKGAQVRFGGNLGEAKTISTKNGDTIVRDLTVLYATVVPAKAAVAA